MIALPTLRYLASQNLRDAEILFRNNRNTGTVYLMGYALELSFKRKVSQTLGFIHGFPESAADFNIYSAQVASFNAISTGIVLTRVKQVKNHDLNDLLIFSGAQPGILGSYYNDWLRVKDWNPENRYKRQYVTNVRAREFIVSAKQILKQIV